MTGAFATESSRTIAGSAARKKLAIDSLFCLIVFTVIGVQLGLTAPGFDADLWWHLRAGDFIAAHHAVPMVDTFSSSVAGKPWIDYSWLFDLISAALFHWGGFAAIRLLSLIPVLGAALILGALASRRLPLLQAAILVAAGCLAMAPLRTPRPWLCSIAFFAVELWLLFSHEQRRQPGLLWSLIPLFALWANLHIQFVYGMAVLLLFACAACVHRKLYWTVLIACCLATLVNPYGWRIYEVVWNYASQRAPLVLVEEMLAMQFRSISDWLVLMVAAAAIFSLGWNRKRAWLLYALIVLAGLAAFRSGRDSWFLVLIACAVMAECWTQRPVYQAAPLSTEPAFRWSASIALILVSATVWVSSPAEDSMRTSVSRSFPAGASAFIEHHQLRGPLYNSYDWGGYLMWRLPALKVSIDGRANLYEDYLPQASEVLNSGNNWRNDKQLKKAALIVIPRQAALRSVLMREAGYRVLFEDQLAVVLAP